MKKSFFSFPGISLHIEGFRTLVGRKVDVRQGSSRSQEFDGICLGSQRSGAYNTQGNDMLRTLGLHPHSFWESLMSTERSLEAGFRSPRDARVLDNESLDGRPSIFGI